MGFGWLKKLGSIGSAAAHVGALVDPVHFGPLVLLIEAVQRAMPDKPGADKKAVVEAMSDTALDALVEAHVITLDQATQARALRSAAIDDYVAFRNIEAKAEASRVAYETFVASFHPPTT